KRQTNRQFYVVRFLTARLSRAMYLYLGYIRRLANLLRREQVGHSEAAKKGSEERNERLLFHVNGKAWPTSRLTEILVNATLKVWNQPINVHLYRQLAIAITERHVREVHKYDDLSSDTDRNAVFAWQSGHRPLQRETTYGLDGAYPFRLQPALLRAYEWASTRWHEFLHQPSKRWSLSHSRAPISLETSMKQRKRNTMQTNIKPAFFLVTILRKHTVPTTIFTIFTIFTLFTIFVNVVEAAVWKIKRGATRRETARWTRLRTASL
ncbi:hypothetical protein IWW34DRAFT_634627, partial [Fusarium oxysporum f. sp. albedinis]